MSLSVEDLQFICDFLAEELDYEKLVILDEKLKNLEFREEYNRQLNAKYKIKKGKFMGYFPMIVLVILVLLGIYLIYKST